MPRVKELKPLYMSQDIGSFIVGEMFRKKIKHNVLAKELKVTDGGLNYKLSNNAFTYSDLIVTFKVLGLTDEQIIKVMKI